MGCSKNKSKRKHYSNEGLPQETRRISNKQPNLPSKESRKRRTNKAQNQENEGNKDQRGINKIESKKQ